MFSQTLRHDNILEIIYTLQFFKTTFWNGSDFIFVLIIIITFKIVLVPRPCLSWMLKVIQYWNFVKNLRNRLVNTRFDAAQKMRFSINDFFTKCDQIHRKLQIWSHLLKKSLMGNFIFGAVWNFTENCPLGDYQKNLILINWYLSPMTNIYHLAKFMKKDFFLWYFKSIW